MQNTVERNVLKAKTLQSLRINNITLPTATGERPLPPERRINFVFLGEGMRGGEQFRSEDGPVLS